MHVLFIIIIEKICLSTLSELIWYADLIDFHKTKTKQKKTTILWVMTKLTLSGNLEIQNNFITTLLEQYIWIIFCHSNFELGFLDNQSQYQKVLTTNGLLILLMSCE